MVSLDKHFPGLAVRGIFQWIPISGVLKLYRLEGKLAASQADNSVHDPLKEQEAQNSACPPHPALPRKPKHPPHTHLWESSPFGDDKELPLNLWSLQRDIGPLRFCLANKREENHQGVLCYTECCFTRLLKDTTLSTSVRIPRMHADGRAFPNPYPRMLSSN